MAVSAAARDDVEKTINAAVMDAAAAAAVTIPGGRSSVWQHRHLVLGAGAIFLYVGAEVAIGSFLVNFVAQPQIAGLSLDEVRDFMTAEGVAAYKLPDHLVLVAEMPLTKVGKIDKRALREDITSRAGV